jgi:DNA-binding transcriptional MerR regulator
VAEQGQTGLTTAAVAARLGVSPSTVRRYIKENYLPEPGWGKVGRKNQRVYTEAWVRAAEKKLNGDDSRRISS